ncbi:SNARE domain protein [Ancylostoma caninum]|uniref:SNARE domain protein n=1 Tax=Ancylostoma caninum TaxID=29170 RepID=A0A368H5Q8_ANCCA|nr:SNARE domain protein [Ancylostoma caninum]
MAVKRGDIDNFPNLAPPSDQGNERLKLKMVDFDAEILRLNYEALGCTNRMVAELEKINEDGVMALAALENQDEQLDKLESNLHQINDDISAVRNDIKKMERCCCFNFLCLPLKRYRKNKDKENKERAVASSIIVKNRPSIRRRNADFIPKLTEDAIEDEIEGNLRQVDDTLNSIKHLAVDINVQLSIQEPKLDRIQDLMENSDLAMGGANERVKKLLSD